MRRITAAVLAALMMLMLASCEKAAGKDEAPPPVQEVSQTVQTGEDDTSASVESLGAWIIPDTPVVSDELAALFAKAAGGLTGAQHIPVAYIGRQTVSGVNHEFICRERIVSPGTPETYSIVRIHEDTEGNAEIKDILNTGIPTWISPADAPLPGGWVQSGSPEITEKLAELMNNAFEGMLGADHVPVALLSTQAVAGTNYCVLCEQTVVYPGAEPEYVFVYLYEDLDGNAQITDTVSWHAAEADSQ